MKLKITYILPLLFFCSCTNKYKTNLIGKWYETNSRYVTKIEFQKDTLYLKDYSDHFMKWTAKKNEIQYDFKLMFPDSTGNKTKKVTLYYTLNREKDTLKIESSNDSINELVFIKADNFTDFLFKQNNIEINLDSNLESNLFDEDPFTCINIFIGFKNDSLIAKTEYSDNINNLNNDLKIRLSTLKTEIERDKDEMLRILDIPKDELEKNDSIKILNNWINRNVYYSVFVDKQIDKKTISKYFKILKESKIKKIYQIHMTDEEPFGATIHRLKGIEI